MMPAYLVLSQGGLLLTVGKSKTRRSKYKSKCRTEPVWSGNAPLHHPHTSGGVRKETHEST